MFVRIRHLADRKGSNRLMVRLRALLRSNEFYLIPLALVIGTLAGAIVTLMAEIAQIAHMVIYGIPVDVRLSANARVSPWAALIAPALGGLALGIMEWSRRRMKISSAVDPIEANALRGGNLSMRDSLVVSSQTLISNGCGASVGLEAGYTQIGSGIASLLGKFFNLRRNDLRLMVGCGAAAAIAAAFGAPITGAFYACELIVGVYSVGSAAPILAASLAGALTAQWLGGAPYSLEIPKVSAVGVEQYLALIGLALITSGVGIAVMRSSPMFERLFAWLPVWLRPVMGGLVVGGFAIVTPQVLAAGHGAMVLDLFHDMTIGLIALIIALKVTACLISLASGFRGGLFFASLFVGSLIGKFFSAVLLISPNFVIDPLVAMLTGMATLGVAIVGGPLTMSFLVLEMTRNVDVTAVVLAGCIVTSICVRFMFGHSFSTWRLHLRGETIRSANDVGWLRNLTVERLMRSDVGKVPSTTTIAAVRREFVLGSRPGVVIVNNADEYIGLVLLPDLFSSDLDTIADDIQVIELARLIDIVLIPEMNVKSAMAVFDEAEAEMLAVVDSTDSRKVVGFLTENFARRRYVEEIDKATRGVLGALS
ncbi:chloride channel protein [Bradyrhizobium sp. YCK136]|uniref:chloride channel protein n=1 Tax=Bradyrhizobium TaxID=374 RepID=UPI001B8CDD4C|nr:chloride channel protein [Bradyrhizobium diazoefficiens]MBR0862405.1 chloride channel protein [Bradyrhizobium diazoefficiens]MBR0885816.1 chloride channel protein [Bradyrhizobium diazoefficiens]MBR0917544.1 chloride channel protein [Bradyrhizobium diazoefficiens]